MINRRAFIALTASLPLAGLCKSVAASQWQGETNQLIPTLPVAEVTDSLGSELGIYGWHDQDDSKKIFISLSSNWKSSWR